MKRRTKERFLPSAVFVIMSASVVILTLSLGFDDVFQAQISSTEELNGKVMHGPAVILSCLDCHDRAQPNDINNIVTHCFECHDDFVPKNPIDYTIHTPLFDNGCTKCHEVHSTKNHYLLVEPEQQLCMRCHSDLFKRYGTYSHFVKNCSGCHSPHFARYEHLFIADPVGLCTQPCHDGFQTERSHPLGRNVVDPKTGREMTCTSNCHVIHSSAYKALTPTANRKLCESCHEDKF